MKTLMKTLFLASCFLLLNSAYAQVAISKLPPVTDALNDSDVLPAVHEFQTYKISLAQIEARVLSLVPDSTNNPQQFTGGVTLNPPVTFQGLYTNPVVTHIGLNDTGHVVVDSVCYVNCYTLIDSDNWTAGNGALIMRNPSLNIGIGSNTPGAALEDSGTFLTVNTNLGSGNTSYLANYPYYFIANISGPQFFTSVPTHNYIENLLVGNWLGKQLGSAHQARFITGIMDQNGHFADFEAYYDSVANQFNCQMGNGSDPSGDTTNVIYFNDKTGSTYQHRINFKLAYGTGTPNNVYFNSPFNTANPVIDIEAPNAQAGIKIHDGTQGANKVLTSDANGIGSWQPRLIAYAFDSAQVNSIDTIISEATPVYGTYRVGGYMNITSCTTNQAQMNFIYTDETGLRHSVNLSNLSIASGTGLYTGRDVTIHPLPGTAISIFVSLPTTGGSITYNADAYIELVHQ